MSCVKVTPRPSYYARLEELPPEPEPILTGRVTICFDVAGPTDYYRTRRQAAIRDVVAMALGAEDFTASMTASSPSSGRIQRNRRSPLFCCFVCSIEGPSS